MRDSLIIATRESPLALWQANYVKMELERHHPKLEISLLGITSRGDKLLNTPLAKVGGKGLFVKELENSLINGAADIAVHSMKDVPAEFPVGLHVGAICEREDPRDAFVSGRFSAISDLPVKSVIGTSSLRRACQLREFRPDLEIRFLRGNVNTRLRKLDDGEYDAIILASAGLIRLGMIDRVSEYMSLSISLPAVGQGAIGIECRDSDQEVLNLLAPLHHLETEYCVAAERAFNSHLEGGCQIPIAGFAELRGDEIFLRGLVGNPDGSKILRAQAAGSKGKAETLGIEVADALIEQGARELLAKVNGS